jgi:transcriptional regulator with XRE-family HTH domain
MVSSRTLYEDVGRRIRDVRLERGISQEELAAALSLTRTSVTNIERGRQRILVHTLLQVAEVLGTHVGKLLPSVESITSMEAEEILPRDLPEHERQWIAGVAASAQEP